MERNSGAVSYLGGGVEDRKRVESKLSFLLAEPSPIGFGSKRFSLQKKPNVESFKKYESICIFFQFRAKYIDIYPLFTVYRTFQLSSKFPQILV